MQLVKGLVFATIAMMCFASADGATPTADVKMNAPKPRKLYYVRTRSPYNRNNPPLPPSSA
ncbi:hypothetical protein F441_19813 [Phytophthora nicotianae CJ01A1]|uniref:RxLR effector protein n=6 Tax=Phytophthora nicotianae TaxID=4792 RepID=W2PL26_PHYN3|nr:hypothetical protein PPTG_24224 [Phytophthora nicotianae INRA-310]ETI33365.1 hypothetical protein F443_19953 [Phytophthora nicotianae P1569]ETK73674.1 hypothetical protein L915_19436 [Phytophthora nicotianae]ETO62122.1 hypothetical protein F444_19945 [Phytophthora nicotianae P1976]ETP03208.1 hypothetical protein F441_19813 [Phytophthora nicotianae CJ01A1]ETP31329.1 hypothetical protein F442_19797 [Phytophthora nicotianae P10297]